MDSHLVQKTESVFGSFMAQVYAWMVVGLILTFSVAFGVTFVTERNPQLLLLVATLTPFVLIGQLIIVLVISLLGNKLNKFVLAGLFLFYSLTMGVFFGVIFLGYTTLSIFLVFGATVVTFAIMAIYGAVTKQDLTGWGRLALFGLLGIIIASLLNLIFYFFVPGAANTINWVLTYLGVGIFLILIAYDSQRLKNMAITAEQNGEDMTKVVIHGALTLYLDFINLFMRLLMIMGKRK